MKDACGSYNISNRVPCEEWQILLFVCSLLPVFPAMSKSHVETTISVVRTVYT